MKGEHPDAYIRCLSWVWLLAMGCGKRKVTLSRDVVFLEDKTLEDLKDDNAQSPLGGLIDLYLNPLSMVHDGGRDV